MPPKGEPGPARAARAWSCGTLNRLLEQAAEQAGIAPEEIYRAVVAGNSTMIHLFAALPPESIRLVPFVTTVNQLPPLRAHELGLRDPAPRPRWTACPVSPATSAADITAGVVSSGMCTGRQADPLHRHRHQRRDGAGRLHVAGLLRLLGRAGLRGSGVVHGMRATAGAIEEVWINPQTYEPTIRVIGPEGESRAASAAAG